MEPVSSIAGNEDFLECEKWMTFVLLIFVGGYLGAFTYTIRGGVFCNAQTANFVLSAIALGSGDFYEFIYYFIPMSAYFLGAFISESVPSYVKLHFHVRWDTLLIFIEMLTVVFLGLLPESAPYRITHVTVNLIASMQYNTFRQARHIPMATTFCTNHIRQVGVALYGTLTGSAPARERLLAHGGMLLAFVLGGALSTACCGPLLGRTIWLAEIPLGIVLLELLRADLGRERARREQLPHGY